MAGSKKGKGKGKRFAAEDDEELPGGPETLEQILNFPDVVWERLFSSDNETSSQDYQDRLARLRQCLGRAGLELHSQYSGKGTAESAAGQLSKLLASKNAIAATGVGAFVAKTAFDLKPFAVDVLRSHACASRPRCIFGDLKGSLSARAREELDRLTPAKAQSAEARADAFDAMDKYLKEHSATALPRDVKAPCFIHSSVEGCRVWADDEPDGPRPFQLWVAGQTCKDVSMRGLRRGFSGPHTKTYIIWVAMVRSQQPDMFIHEITCSAEAAERLRADLEDMYEILTCDCLSPSLLGIPVHRPRQYSIGVLRGKYIHVGSWDEFRKLLRSKCQIAADVFFQATDEHRAEVGRNLARRHGWFVADGDEVALQDQLTPAEWRRVGEYQAKASKMQMAEGAFFCFDVEQEVKFGSISRMAPCLVSHGKIIHGQRLVLATGLEHLLVMGVSAAA